MALRYRNFSLSLPIELHRQLKEYAENNTRTMTGVILETLRWRLEAETGGRRKCVTGEGCALAVLQEREAGLSRRYSHTGIGG